MHEHERINRFLPLVRDLYNSAKKNLGFKPHAKIVIIKSDKNMKNPLGKTAYYSPSDYKIALYTQGRHIKDIMRSLAHELVHHNQNCRGDFAGGAATVDGYAQEDGDLREMEREAYECGNMIFRDWEDNLKKKGGKPLFTSTNQYVRPMMTDVIGSRLLEGKKMNKKINESHLRNIIRGVIQEMFNEDLNEEDNMGMPADVESQEAAQQASEEPQPYESGVDIGEGMLGKVAGGIAGAPLGMAGIAGGAAAGSAAQDWAEKKAGAAKRGDDLPKKKRAKKVNEEDVDEGILGKVGGAALGLASPIPGGMALGAALGGGLEDKLKGNKRNDDLPKKKKKIKVKKKVGEESVDEGWKSATAGGGLGALFGGPMGAAVGAGVGDYVGGKRNTAMPKKDPKWTEEEESEFKHPEEDIEEGKFGTLAKGLGKVAKQAYKNPELRRKAKSGAKKLGKAAMQAAGEEAMAQASRTGMAAAKKVGSKLRGTTLGSEYEETGEEKYGDYGDDDSGVDVYAAPPSQTRAMRRVNESFFPKNHSIRQKARNELNENLMQRWGYTKKEK